MACGVPVIASAVGENPSLVPDDTGILVEEPQDWQTAVQTLSDPQVRGEMGRNAREHIVEHYSIHAVGQQIQSAFQDLLDV
jgi:glycosyltransferase involved in cell wall biosynthesis